MGLQDQRCRKVLHHETAVEMPDIDLVHIRGRDLGVDQGFGHRVDDQRFKLDTFVLAEFGMGPAHDATGHGEFLVDKSDG